MSTLTDKTAWALVVGVTLISKFALAATCVSFSSFDSPARISSAQVLGEVTSVWCYEKKIINTQQFEFVYRQDVSPYSPELSLLSELNNQGKVVSVTHAAISRGKIGYFKSRLSDFNPLGVPSTLNAALAEGKVVSDRSPFSDASNQLDQGFLRLLFSNPIVLDAQVREGVFESSLPEAQQPYRGYWWKSDELAQGERSPLAKYDAFVEKASGRNPGSTVWEKQHHSEDSVGWSGHCNGWAAASVLYPEPTKFLWDPVSQNFFFPSDLKGILAESSFCANWAFYGHRYWGNPGDELRDIHPDLFHKVLVYYLDQIKKPIALDYYRDEKVDNNVVTGYRFEITRESGNPHRFHVDAKLKRHDYDHDRDERSGKAPSAMKGIYHYTLEVDDAGQITGGEWDTRSDNPDFLWVPLSPSENCTSRNAGMELAWVNKILNLPAAKIERIPLNIEVTRPLKSHESLSFPVSISGTPIRFHWVENGFSHDTVELVSTGEDPYEGGEGSTAELMDEIIASEKSVVVGATNTWQVTFKNLDDHNTDGSHVKLDWVDVLRAP